MLETQAAAPEAAHLTSSGDYLHVTPEVNLPAFRKTHESLPEANERPQI